MHDLPANDHAVALITVPATIEECFAVALDLEAYPEWAESIAAVEVEQRDEAGRPLRARFEATGIGRRSAYVLAYDLAGAPGRLAWTMVEGDLTDRLEGAYTFEPTDDGTGSTDVTYELTVGLAVPLPGYVRRRVEDKILEAALRRFGERVMAIGNGGPGLSSVHRW